MIRIAIFASGSGSNAEKIVEYFADNEQVEVALFLTNNAEAGIVERGKRLGVSTIVFDRKTFATTEKIKDILKHEAIDWVVLAGFLWLVPKYLIDAFPHKMINIHPALLPKFGGKGMWGHHVHEAVVAAKEVQSGITIHYVNEHYDEGAIILQATCDVLPTDTPEDVAKKVQVLEYQYFAKAIESLLKKSD